jgi:SAM-dependent methyltransferase
MIGFDLSMAVEAAYQNIGFRPNVHIIQADVMRPPFPEETFDIIFSIGVLHHTPDPKKSFSCLVPLMKNGGQIAIWVYVKSKWAVVSDTCRKFTTKMPWRMVLAISKALVRLHWFYEKFPHLWKFLPISMHRNPEWRLLDTFDWYSPKYQHKYTENEVKSWFREMKLQDIQTLSSPVSVRGRRVD